MKPNKPIARVLYLLIVRRKPFMQTSTVRYKYEALADTDILPIKTTLHPFVQEHVLH